MKFSLACSGNMKRILDEIIKVRKISIEDDSDFVLTEKGYELSEDKISIVFEYNTLEKLVDLLDLYTGKNENSTEIIIGKKDDGYELIQYDRVLCFEAEGNYTYCRTMTGQYRVKEKLYGLENILPKQSFVRISKSYIINIMNVTEVLPWFGGRLLIRFKGTDIELEVARNYARSFREFLGL